MAKRKYRVELKGKDAYLNGRKMKRTGQWVDSWTRYYKLGDCFLKVYGTIDTYGTGLRKVPSWHNGEHCRLFWKSFSSQDRPFFAELLASTQAWSLHRRYAFRKGRLAGWGKLMVQALAEKYGIHAAENNARITTDGQLIIHDYAYFSP